ncbi:MAG TPA: glycosyltransferase family 2 protein [Gaiellaceae bacterium]|nr:glycosyltransferase family 2 protein [Gaiellaceae bacterium]
MADSPLPFVTVAIPARNEERHLGACLDAVLAQDYPRDRFEVLVVDGASEDRTRTIAEERAARADVPLRVVENPRRVIPTAINAALREARGEYLVRVDAHSIPAPGYVRHAVEANLALGADLVGAWVEPVGTTPFTRAVAAAFRSPFGTANATSWRRPAEPVDVASAPCGSYRVAALRAIGGYDEEQLVNEDYEANVRLREAGGRVVLSPHVSFEYVPRDSFGGLVRQFFRYGFYRARTMAKHPSSVRPRHLAPAVALAALAVLAVAVAAVPAAWPLLAAVAAAYAAGVALATARSARDAGDGWPLLLLVFPTMHVAWGLGNLLGLARWLPARRSFGRGPTGVPAEAR